MAVALALAPGESSKEAQPNPEVSDRSNGSMSYNDQSDQSDLRAEQEDDMELYEATDVRDVGTQSLGHALDGSIPVGRWPKRKKAVPAQEESPAESAETTTTESGSSQVEWGRFRYDLILDPSHFMKTSAEPPAAPQLRMMTETLIDEVKRPGSATQSSSCFLV
jgi:hypothetical protein